MCFESLSIFNHASRNGNRTENANDGTPCCWTERKQCSRCVRCFHGSIMDVVRRNCWNYALSGLNGGFSRGSRWVSDLCGDELFWPQDMCIKDFEQAAALFRRLDMCSCAKRSLFFRWECVVWLSSFLSNLYNLNFFFFLLIFQILLFHKRNFHFIAMKCSLCVFENI